MSATVEVAGVVVVTVSLGTTDDDVDDDDTSEDEGGTHGDALGRTLDDGLGLNAGAGRALVRVAVVRGSRAGQLARCFCAIHSGAPRLIASSGQVMRYIEMSSTVCQRPSRYDTQYGSPERALAITAQPSPQLMTREPDVG